MAIPKVIHYCWFGGNSKPKLAEKCIKSWKKYCPDWKIVEWNEENFDLHDVPLYVRQAMEAGRWAFVTDYVRLRALTEQGGVYMDTDVELVKPLDPYLKHQAFAGFEHPERVQKGEPDRGAAGFTVFSLALQIPERFRGVCVVKDVPAGGLVKDAVHVWTSF